MTTLERPIEANAAHLLAEQYIALRDERALYRGKWLICADCEGHFWALHDSAVETDKSTVVEERQFAARLDASRFMRHLLLHGWSIYGQSEGDILDQLW
ncbi:MAG: hypothetical protein KFB97_07675 [Cyanobium sp. M30B3]|jgi:hypothetical protein|nr:MAG: hypothetical protein KFB97_07675 [Cyanobium sp. M30B3]